jgi:UPF0271 protein
MTALRIDLSADVGELPQHLVEGTEEQLLQFVTSANIACGGHAGSPESMYAVVQLCLKHGVAIGAHPGYPDPDHFGRRSLQLDAAVLEASIREQVAALDAIARDAGATLRHIKPHGGLYNDAVHDAERAGCFARAVAEWKPSVVLVGLAGSPMLEVWRDHGFRVAAEAFTDRRYEPDGTLRSRQLPDAVLEDPAAAAAQALSIVTTGGVTISGGSRVAVAADTLCLHGDTRGALDIAQRIRGAFAAHGILVHALAGEESK